MKKPTTSTAKPRHGGPRPNATGRPPIDNPRVSVHFRLDPEIVAYLRQHPVGMTAAIESAIKESKQFRQWISKASTAS